MKHENRHTGGFKYLVVVVLTVCICFANAMGVKAGGLNYNEKTLYILKSVKLKVDSKKKVKWSSSNKKVAKVSKNGKVTAIKSGKAVITAKVGKKKYTCSIKVKKYPIEQMKTKVNEYFAKQDDYYRYLFVAEDLSYEKIGKTYRYWIRSRGEEEANVLVGTLDVNSKTGKAVFEGEGIVMWGEIRKMNILK